MIRLTIITIALLTLNALAVAQSGDAYDMTWNSLDGGGGTSTGATFTLRGTIGQSDAGSMSGGTFELNGGFQLGSGSAVDPPSVGDDLCSGGSNDGGSCSTDAECPGGACGLKSRYVSISAPAAVVAAAGSLSIQVTIVDVDDALGQDDVEGQVWWAVSSQELPNTPNPDLTGAQLACESMPSHSEVWPSGVLHLFGAPIIPRSVYEVRMCDATGANCSDPLIAGSGVWGDVRGVSSIVPDGTADFADINGIVAKFQGSAGAVDIVRADLRSPGGQALDFSANFADVNAALGAFQGAQYSFTIPACP